MYFKSAISLLIIIVNGLLCGLVFAQNLSSADSHHTPAVVSDDILACSIEPELQVLLDMHNRSRRRGLRCGTFFKRSAPSLKWSCELASASKKHADDMAMNGFLAHKGSDDSTFSERATEAGFEWLNVGENIAQGYDLPEKAYRGWIGSQAHCKTISSQQYQEFGASKIEDYWVVMFGRR